jgi:hypothetical protein
LEFWKFWGFSKPNEKNPNFLVFQSRQRGRAEGSQGWPVNPSIMQSYAHFLGILCTGSGGFLGIIYAWIASTKASGFEIGPFREKSGTLKSLYF